MLFIHLRSTFKMHYFQLKWNSNESPIKEIPEIYWSSYSVTELAFFCKLVECGWRAEWVKKDFLKTFSKSFLPFILDCLSIIRIRICIHFLISPTSTSPLKYLFSLFHFKYFFYLKLRKFLLNYCKILSKMW